MRVLLWVVALVPLAVFGVVASSVGQKEGMHVFQSLIWLIVVVVAGLACQVIWYLIVSWRSSRGCRPSGSWRGRST